jgi:phospholipase/carboxylesterase
LVILLHGLGSNEEDLLGLAPYLDPALEVCSLRAPFSYGDFGYKWFSLELTPEGVHYDLEEARTSLAQVVASVQALQRELDLGDQNTVLGGFSQGAMLSTAALFSEPGLAAGYWLMSGASVPEMEQGAFTNRRRTSVLVQHGVDDQVVEVERGRTLRLLLETKLSVDLTYREYPMGHSISQESLEDGIAWLNQVLQT